MIREQKVAGLARRQKGCGLALLPLLAATDPVEPIHDYNIPILPFKRPPMREDFPEPKKRNKKPENQPHPPQTDHGHVDEYA